MALKISLYRNQISRDSIDKLWNSTDQYNRDLAQICVYGGGGGRFE